LLFQHDQPVQMGPEQFHFFVVHGSIVHHGKQSIQRQRLGKGGAAF
jgi:hypothetical protein